MPIELTFKKSGKEIRASIGNRVQKLKDRLKKRNIDLDSFMDNREKLRSYLVRSGEFLYGHGTSGQPAPLYNEKDISSEEKEETQQLCKRIFEIEQELSRLCLIREHLQDKQEFNLTYRDLVAYGFEPTMPNERGKA